MNLSSGAVFLPCLENSKSMFALIDCDNFFVSCERIFQPNLKNRPVVVLSNNDGCVVARSYEAKSLGIPMAAPFFKIEKQFKAAGGIALSSNYELYADISQRIMSLIRDEFQNLEIYSIDEAFVHLPEKGDYFKIAQDFHNKILKYIGVSVSIGVAPTKTLCKLAGEYAKTHSKVFVLTEQDVISQMLSKTDVEQIWGIGKHSAQKLNFMGIFTGEDLRLAPRALLRKSMGINAEKTALELNGLPCLEAENDPRQKTIISSRSFEKEISDFNQLEQIISEFVDGACLRLRNQKSLATGIITYISSNRFNQNQIPYQNSILISLAAPSNNTAKFLKAMKLGLQQIYRADVSYKRAGVTLTEIQDENLPQYDLLRPQEENGKERKLMAAFDEINRKIGKKSVYFGIQKSGVQYFIRRNHKSRNFTTSWNDLASVS